MGWDQSTGRQDVQSFLLDLMGIDPDEILREALATKMAEQGLTHEVVPDPIRDRLDSLFDAFIPDKVILSDGRIFVEALTSLQTGDSWGDDNYSFVEAGKPYTRTHKKYSDGEEPHVTVEEVPGDTPMPSNLEELRAEGNATTPGMGDEIANFFASQGIKQTNFKPGEGEGGD